MKGKCGIDGLWRYCYWLQLLYNGQITVEKEAWTLG